MTYLDSHIAILIIREHNTRYCFRSILSENLSFILARIPDTSDDLKTMTRLKKKLTIPKLIFNSTTKSVILAKEIMLMCLRRFFVSSVAKIFVKLVKKFTEDFDRLKTTGPQTVMKKERK